MTMEVAGLCEVMSWVMGFGRHAEVLEPVGPILLGLNCKVFNWGASAAKKRQRNDSQVKTRWALTGSGRKRVGTDGGKGTQSTFCTNVSVDVFIRNSSHSHK